MSAETSRRAFLGRGTAALGLAATGLAWQPDVAEAANATRYEWSPPWMPRSAADVVVQRIGSGGITVGAKGDTGKVLLLVAPDGPIAGPVIARDLRYAGVLLVGATFKTVGQRTKVAPSGAALRGEHVVQISFDGEVARSRPPYAWLSNILVDQGDCWWGDFVRVGTSTDYEARNWARWCDVYLQKILVRHGHYGWTAPGNDYTPHSDFIQTPIGGIRSLNIADCDIAWGYQTFFARPEKTRIAYPDGIYEFRRVVTRPMPASRRVYGSNVPRLSRYLTMTERAQDVRSGKYYAHRASNFHIVPQPELDVPFSRHFSAQGLTSINGRDYVTWNTVRSSARRHPVWSGIVRIGAPSQPFVTSGDVGPGQRLSSAADLLRRFG
jgi:hypothetical protein